MSLTRFHIVAFALCLCAAAWTPTTEAASANPDISVNALMLYKYSNRGINAVSENRNGATLQEAEMQFASDVDPYWRFVGTFSISPQVNQDKLKANIYDAPYGIDPEEAYAESLDFSRFTIRVGKFKAALGKHNQLHTHAYPFVDAPLQNQILLGDEGFNDAGASLATLLPLPWYSEIMLQGFSGQAEGLTYFNPPTTGNAVGLVHFKNLWDLSDELTAEFGMSAATGANTYSSSTNFYGLDLTFKWRRSLEKALIWASEFLRRDVDAGAGETGQGIASWLQFQPARRWWFEARGEYLEVRNPILADNTPYRRKQSLVAAFDPSEFSEVRIQLDHLSDGVSPDENRGLLQLNYTIGAHPAHAY